MIGKIMQISQDFLNGNILVSLAMKQCSVQELQMLSDYEELDVDMKKHRERRSRDANAYFHVLVGKIADVMNPPLPKPYVKNILIGKYGQPEIVDGEPVHIKTELSVERMLEQEYLHCSPCGVKVEDGRELFFYNVMRGSRTYNSKEMSILISGTCEEARQLGVEVLPPDELKRMVEAWKAS